MTLADEADVMIAETPQLWETVHYGMTDEEWDQVIADNNDIRVQLCENTNRRAELMGFDDQIITC